ncbi:MAG: bifunctional diaminohydroxyphosphoribosylaminopyrimidine deaminase/5-amino-6-(5-phosphoribosylamino)uracil reductase RibD [Sphingomonadales bacterium]
MHAALTLAERGLGRVAPNPAVGCVLVKDGAIIARGWTQPGGRPHAEAEALARAGAAARGATAYVSLEPCAHHGVTAPCADALIGAGVARVVIAAGDPDPRTNGAGLARLRQAGIAVTTDVLAPRARALNAGFILKVRQNRPLVSAKLAVSLDGRVATGAGDSQWITGAAARRHGHLERARHDAIMVGAGTLRADNPSLTCRLPGLEGASPQRVVVLGRQPADPALALLRDPECWVFGAAPGAIAIAPGADGLPDPAAVLAALAARGITRLLLEGGPALITGFLRAGLVDRLLWYQAPRLIGGDGHAAIGGLSVAKLAQTLDYRPAGECGLGPDRLLVYIRHGLDEELAATCSPES